MKFAQPSASVRCRRPQFPSPRGRSVAVHHRLRSPRQRWAPVRRRCPSSRHLLRWRVVPLVAPLSAGPAGCAIGRDRRPVEEAPTASVEPEPPPDVPGPPVDPAPSGDPEPSFAPELPVDPDPPEVPDPPSPDVDDPLGPGPPLDPPDDPLPLSTPRSPAPARRLPGVARGRAAPGSGPPPRDASGPTGRASRPAA